MDRPNLDKFVLSPIQRKRKKSLDPDSIIGSILEQLAGDDGDDGVSVVTAVVNKAGHLILTLSNKKEIDAGKVKGEDGDTPEIDIVDIVNRVLALIPEPESVDTDELKESVISAIPQKTAQNLLEEIQEQGLKLPLSVLEDFETVIESAKKESKEHTDRKVGAIRMTGGNTNIRLKQAGASKGQVETINFSSGATITPVGDGREVNISITSGTGQVNSIVAGSNITVDATDPANPIVSATGGGSFAVMVPTGTVDGSNKSFIFSSAPSVIVVDDGSTMNKTRKDGQANWSGTTTVVMTVAPNGNIFGY